MTLELGFLGSVLQVDLPGNAGGKQLTQSSSNHSNHSLGTDLHVCTILIIDADPSLYLAR